jgi:hypothetical protein
LFGAFLTAGLYKATPAFAVLNVDLTLFLAVLTLLACGWALVQRRMRVPRALGWVLLLYGCLVPGVAAATSSYSMQKVLTVFTLGLLASLAPLFLVRSDRHVGQLYWFISAVGIVMAGLALTGHINNAQLGRYTVLDANTTQTGEVIGVALIWILVLVTARRARVVLGLGVAAGLGIAMVGTGARGPLVSAIAAIVVALAFGSGGGRRRSRRLLILAAVIVTLLVGYRSAPYYSQTRLLTVGTSGEQRIAAYSASLDAIPSHPLGIGWGNWADFVGPDVAQGNSYPHDLVLEVFLEGGWIAGIGLLWFLFRVGRSAFRWSAGPIGQATLALFLFYLIETLLSGDLVDARVFLAICSLILVREVVARRARYHASRARSPQGDGSDPSPTWCEVDPQLLPGPASPSMNAGAPRRPRFVQPFRAGEPEALRRKRSPT